MTKTCDAAVPMIEIKHKDKGEVILVVEAETLIGADLRRAVPIFRGLTCSGPVMTSTLAGPPASFRKGTGLRRCDEGMSAWRRIAIEKIPRYRKLVEQASTVMHLWTQLRWPFVEAHSAPIDEQLIKQVYDYASWCLASNDPNTFTAVIVAFYEDLPVHPEVRKQVARWVSAEEFSGLEEAFRYHLDDREHSEFIREVYEQRARLRRSHENLPT